MKREKPQCATCIHLQTCHEVTEKRILDEYCCRLWQAAKPSELDARKDIVRNFGPWALRYGTLEYKARKSARPKRTIRRRKKNV